MDNPPIQWSLEALDLMNKKGLYRHYKGGMYQLLEVAFHSETLEELAVYRELYDNYDVSVRPLKMFIETVEMDGQRVPRFAYIGAGDAAKYN